MSDIAIKVENLSKLYRIGGKQERYRTLRDSLTDAVSTAFRRLSSIVRGQSAAVTTDTIWALKDVSFEVKKGEVVGIIGRNGAGKSTLLKILSRITEPSEGRAEIHGRVGSLLEVGTGFHPELTGRENIYLNGAILGMKRDEIDRKFDEIVDFAEVEKFIDTPVKHYSSGMYLRLAFAVAAHLDPEILLVDEVLAVGDAAFQKKCLGKMGDVAREGRTVLFVSHNMGAVATLCNRCVYLNSGNVILKGPAGTVIERYLDENTCIKSTGGKVNLKDALRGTKAKRNLAEFLSVRALDAHGTQKEVFLYGGPIVLEITVCVRQVIRMLQIGAIFRTFLFKEPLFTVPSEVVDSQLNPGCYKFIAKISPNFLTEGSYILWLRMFVNGQPHDSIPEAMKIQIAKMGRKRTETTYFENWIQGFFQFNYRCELTRDESFSKAEAKRVRDRL